MQLGSKSMSTPHGQAAPQQKPVRLEDGQGPFPHFPFKVTTVSSANRDLLLPVQAGCSLLIFFSHLIALARASSTLSNRNGENRHPYRLPDLSGKAFSLSPLNMLLAVEFSKMLFTRLRKFLSALRLLNVFIMKSVAFRQMLCLHLLR